MKTILRWLPAALALSIACDAAADDVRFRVINSTEFAIQGMALSQSDLNSWGPNVLPPPPIKPGEAREIVLRGVFVDCNADLKVVFEGNTSQPVWQYLNICSLQRIRLRFDPYSGVSTASYEE